MAESHFLNLGEFIVIEGDGEIKTLLGSCVGLFLFDKVHKVCGLAHYVLPFHREGEEETAFYGDVAFREMLKKMIKKGAQKIHIRAKIFGGSNLFDHLKFSKDIGSENIQFAIDTLKDNHIPILEENLGGTIPRGLVVNCHTYEVKCDTGIFGQ